MARTKTVQGFKDDSLDLEARIIDAIGSVGPKNIAQISRLTGAHPETVRYKVKKQFKKLGFRIHADVDYKKLGLTLHWSTLHFSPGHYASATKILKRLNEVGYLTYYGKVVPQGHYVAIFALPKGTAEEYWTLLNGLKRQGILKDFTLGEALVSRHLPMDPKYFNFRSGKWEVEWQRLKGAPGKPLLLDEKLEPAPVDYLDLLLVKELQLDALQHVVAIARKLKVNQKNLEYHFTTHVQKKKLIPRYLVRWMQDIEKTLSHSLPTVRLTFRGLTRPEFVKVQTAVSKIPFLWVEDLLSDGTYIATLCIPLEELISTYAYLNDELGDLYSRVDVGYLKPRERELFTIPYNMYDGKNWKFDRKLIESQLTRDWKVALQK